MKDPPGDSDETERPAARPSMAKGTMNDPPISAEAAEAIAAAQAEAAAKEAQQEHAVNNTSASNKAKANRAKKKVAPRPKATTRGKDKEEPPATNNQPTAVVAPSEPATLPSVDAQSAAVVGESSNSSADRERVQPAHVGNGNVGIHNGQEPKTTTTSAVTSKSGNSTTAIDMGINGTDDKMTTSSRKKDPPGSSFGSAQGALQQPAQSQPCASQSTAVVPPSREAEAATASAHKPIDPAASRSASSTAKSVPLHAQPPNNVVQRTDGSAALKRPASSVTTETNATQMYKKAKLSETTTTPIDSRGEARVVPEAPPQTQTALHASAAPQTTNVYQPPSRVAPSSQQKPPITQPVLQAPRLSAQKPQQDAPPQSNPPAEHPPPSSVAPATNAHTTAPGVKPSDSSATTANTDKATPAPVNTSAAATGATNAVMPAASAPASIQPPKAVAAAKPPAPSNDAAPADSSAPVTTTTATAASTTTPSAQAAAPSFPAIPDSAVVEKIVQDMCLLLQTYGPLTFAQLEFNLPPITIQGVESGVPAANAASGILKDILELLTTIGLVQVLQPPPPSQPATPSTADASKPSAAASTTGKSPAERPAPSQPPPPPRYCMCYGVPRVQDDIIMPTNLVSQVDSALEEIEHSQERVRILKELWTQQRANPTSAAGPVREALKSLIRDEKHHEDMMNDPVYVSALRNLHVDVERERRQIEGRFSTQTGNLQQATTQSGSTAVKKKAKKRKLPSQQQGGEGATVAGAGGAKKTVAKKKKKKAVSTSEVPTALLKKPPPTAAATAAAPPAAAVAKPAAQQAASAPSTKQTHSAVPPKVGDVPHAASVQPPRPPPSILPAATSTNAPLLGTSTGPAQPLRVPASPKAPPPPGNVTQGDVLLVKSPLDGSANQKQEVQQATASK